MKKFLFMFICFFLLTLTPVYASEMQVDRGSGDDQSITDIIKDYPDTVTVDDAAMHKADGLFSALGIFLSIIIYVIFAGLAFTTVCDLAYIALPPARPYLSGAYKGGAQGFSSYTRERAVSAERSGNMAQANYLHNRANEIEAHGNGIAHVNEQKGNKGGVCFISSELRSIIAGRTQYQYSQDRNFQATTGINLSLNNKSLLIEYFKKRVVNIVLIVTVVIILLTSTVFTDFGLNIGQYILDTFNSLVGGA